MKRSSWVSYLVCLVVLTGGCGKDKYRQSSAELYYQEAKEALVEGKCYRAQQLFQNLLSDFPGSHLVDEAQYGLGQAYFCDEDYVMARFEYERLLNEYPASPFVDEAGYQVAMCHYHESRDIHHDQDETLQAIRQFSRFVEDFPGSVRTADAEARIRELRNRLAAKSLMIAENYLKWKNYASARLYCEELLKERQDSDSVYLARYVLARAKHGMGDLEDALDDLLGLARDGVPEDLRERILVSVKQIQDDIGDRGSRQAAPDTTAAIPEKSSTEVR